MTAADIREETIETVPVSGCSDTEDVKAKSDATESHDVEEEASASGDFEVEIVVERSEATDQEGGLDDEKQGDEQEGAIEHHVETDSYENGKDKEDEEDCPFCLYMKAGECGESFVDWEQCINEGERTGEDVVEKCVRVTRLLTQCMRANADYYGPVLEAEKAMTASVASGDSLEDAAAQAERTFTEVGAQNAVHEREE